MTNVSGHTLGYYVPWTARSSDFSRAFLPTADWPLKPGMTFHMYAAAQGMAFSETVLVTEDGAEVLSPGAPKTRAEIEALMRVKGIGNLPIR